MMKFLLGGTVKWNGIKCDSRRFWTLESNLRLLELKMKYNVVNIPVPINAKKLISFYSKLQIPKIWKAVGSRFTRDWDARGVNGNWRSLEKNVVTWCFDLPPFKHRVVDSNSHYVNSSITFRKKFRNVMLELLIYHDLLGEGKLSAKPCKHLQSV